MFFFKPIETQHDVQKLECYIPYFLKYCPGTLGKLAISKVQKNEYFSFFIKQAFSKGRTLFKGGDYLRKYGNRMLDITGDIYFITKENAHAQI